MTYCSKCGAAQQEGAKFCTECGAPITNEPARTFEIMPQTESVPQKQQRYRRKKPLLRQRVFLKKSRLQTGIFCLPWKKIFRKNRFQTAVNNGGN